MRSASRSRRGLARGGLAAGACARQTPGVTATEIKIGHTNPYSGPASAYGTIGKAIGAYFKKVNDEGGINGRKINFITYDDGYSPPKTVEMVRRLVEQDQVALVFNTLGTPTNSAIHKYMNQQKVPHLFVATGATKWGDPKNFPWTMGWQPNYQAEGHIYAQYVLKNVPDPKIGILYQNDDYGKDYVKGLKDGLGEAAKKLIVLEQSYEVTDPTDRLADRQPQEQRRQRVLQRHDPEVRRAGDQEGARHRLEAAAPAEQRVQLGRHRAEAGRARRLEGPHHRAVPEGPDGPAVEERPGLQGLASRSCRSTIRRARSGRPPTCTATPSRRRSCHG